MVYRRTERVEARLAQDRERILEAARGLVRDTGFAGAKVVAVAAAAGVSTGSVYRHFPSKGALFSEMLREICARELAVVSAVARTDGAVADRVGAAIAVFAQRSLRSGGLAYAVIVEPMDPEVDEVRLDARRNLSRLFAELIAEGVAAGDFPPQHPLVGGAAVVGAMLEALVRPLEDGAADPDLLVDQVRTFCVRALGGVPA
ncbi:MAG: TetR/AcrR family transcriptional regulator [Sporichthyaceae bacterium]